MPCIGRLCFHCVCNILVLSSGDDFAGLSPRLASYCGQTTGSQTAHHASLLSLKGATNALHAGWATGWAAARLAAAPAAAAALAALAPGG